MIDLYLVTGFLGSGKTTFLKNFVKCFPEKKIFIIVNEFGKVGIDGTLLTGSGEIEEINNGSMFCSCRMDQLEHAFTKAITVHPDLILIETSGLSDPSGIHAIVNRPEYSEIEYRGSICVVDATSFLKVLETAQNCRKQLSVSSIVLLNKCDVAGEEQLTKVQKIILQIQPSAKIHETEYGCFAESWLKDIDSSPVSANVDNRPDITLQKAVIEIAPDTSYDEMEQILKYIKNFTYRTKGFIQLQDGVYFIDCTDRVISMAPAGNLPYKETGKLVALAGKGMPLRNGIRELKLQFPDRIGICEL